MANIVDATFDGKAILPDEPLGLEPNTRVRVLIEAILPANSEPVSVLDIAMSMNLDGPPDWAQNIDKYLYDNLTDDKMSPDESERSLS